MDGGKTISTIPTGTKTIQKMQIRIPPYLFLLYLISYLDRINIGFAALAINKGLAIASQQFGLLVGIASCLSVGRNNASYSDFLSSDRSQFPARF
jgi:sugar phosphate permease